VNIADLPIRLRKRLVVDEGSDCWRWIAGTAGKGYGYFYWQGRMAYVHRITYNLLVDDTLPVHGGGHQHCIDHLCVNRDCVNPSHLELVTWSENLRRFHDANPGHNAKGWVTRRAKRAAA
jgi:hypothetical protein